MKKVFLVSSNGVIYLQEVLIEMRNGLTFEIMKPPNRYITSKVETLKDTAADGSRTTEAIKWACETDT